MIRKGGGKIINMFEMSELAVDSLCIRLQRRSQDKKNLA
jgi:hypothetical protein